MYKKDFHFFDLAEKVSKMSDYKRKAKIGAVITNKSEIISVGVNKLKSHPLQKRLNKLYFSSRFGGLYDGDKIIHRFNIHAELNAILNAGDKNLSGCSIYIFRKDGNGKLGMSRPCKACMALIKKCGIKKVYYTTRDGYAEETIDYD